MLANLEKGAPTRNLAGVIDNLAQLDGDVDRLKAGPKIGRAEALRQAMLGYLNDTSSPPNAYPAFWGPFAPISEGAVR